MPQTKKAGGRCKAGYKQAGRGSTTCLKDAKYEKYSRARKGYVYKTPRKNNDGTWDRRYMLSFSRKGNAPVKLD